MPGSQPSKQGSGGPCSEQRKTARPTTAHPLHRPQLCPNTSSNSSLPAPPTAHQRPYSLKARKGHHHRPTSPCQSWSGPGHCCRRPPLTSGGTQLNRTPHPHVPTANTRHPPVPGRRQLSMQPPPSQPSPLMASMLQALAEVQGANTWLSFV